MDISSLTEKEQVLFLAALDDFLINEYNGSPLEEEKFDLIEAKLVNIYGINKENGNEKVKEMMKDMDEIRKYLIENVL